MKKINIELLLNFNETFLELNRTKNILKYFKIFFRMTTATTRKMI